MPPCRAMVCHPRSTLSDSRPSSAAPFAPFSLEIGATVIGTHLLSMAIDTTIRGIDLRTAQRHSGWRCRIGIPAVFIRLRIEASNLEVRHHRHAEPREEEDPEDAE